MLPGISDRQVSNAAPRPCPNCGGNDVSSTSHRYDPRRGATINIDAKSPGMWGLLTWVVATFLLNGLVPYFFGSRSSLAAAIPFWVPVVLGAGVMLALTVRQEWRLTNSVRIDSYTCRRCGHEWSLRDGRAVSRIDGRS